MNRRVFPLLHERSTLLPLPEGEGWGEGEGDELTPSANTRPLAATAK